MVSADPGLLGSICIDGTTYPMPIKKIIVKEAITVFKYKDPKKLVKSGKNKGQRPTIIKSKAKYRTELDMNQIKILFDCHSIQDRVAYIEMPGNTRGNSAKATKTTMMNYGKLLAVLELLGYRIEEIPANLWKRSMGLPKAKINTIEFVEKATGKSFRTERGALKDGEADAMAIYMYGCKKEKEYASR